MNRFLYGLLLFLWGEAVAQSSFTALKAGGAHFDGGHAITTDASGNIYVTGYFEGTATFGSTSFISNGDWDVFVWKLNSSGVHQWAKRAGGIGPDYGNDIAVDGSGNVYVVGNFRGTATFGGTSLMNGNVFVWKLNSNGEHQWVKKSGGTSSASGGGIALDDSGNVYVAGDFHGKAGFGSTLPQDSLTSSGEGDIFVWKLNSNGAYQWAKQAGGTSDESGLDVALDGSGNVYVVGNFRGTATFGSASFNSNGWRDIFVWKLNSSGEHQWAKKAGGESYHDYGYAVAVDGSGNVYVTGDFGAKAGFGSTLAQDSLTSSGDADIFVWKLNSEGAYQWVKKAGGTKATFDYGTSVGVDGSGNVYVAGGFIGKAGFGSPLPQDSLISNWYDAFVWKLNSSGGYQWVSKTDGIRAENNYNIALDGSGNVYVTGYFYGTSSYGGTLLKSSGLSDVFVWRVAPALTSLTLSAHSVVHGTSANTEVATLSASHVDLGSNPTVTFSIKNANPTTDTFKIEGNKLKTHKAIDYGVLGAAHSPITIVATHTPQGKSALTYEKAFTIAIRPPRLTSISFTGTRQILDNLSVDTKLGILRATGTYLPPKGIVFRIVDGNTAGYFKIVEDSVLKVAKRLLVGVYDLRFRAVYAGVSYEKALAISVTKAPDLLQTSPRPTLNIYPNPTKDKIQIMGLKEGDRIRLLNATGEVLIQELHPLVPLNLNHLPTGSYILEVIRPHYPSLRHKLLKRP